MNFTRDFKDDLIGKQVITDVNEQLKAIHESLPEEEIVHTMAEDVQHAIMLNGATRVLYVTSKAITRLLDPETMDGTPEMQMHRILHASSLWNSRMQGIGPMLELIAMIHPLGGLLEPEKPKKLIISQ